MTEEEREEAIMALEMARDYKVLEAIQAISETLKEITERVVSLEEDREKTKEALDRVAEILCDHMDRVEW